MCPSNCVLLYKAGTPLEDITCLCGYGYWDVLREQFVSGMEVREGKAGSRADYEARLKRRIKDPDERQARLRTQLISHFLGCEAERSAGEETGEGTKALVQALTELQEVLLHKDYHSRGRTAQEHLSESRTPRLAGSTEPLPIRLQEAVKRPSSGESLKDRHHTRTARSAELLEEGNVQPRSSHSSVQPLDASPSRLVAPRRQSSTDATIPSLSFRLSGQSSIDTKTQPVSPTSTQQKFTNTVLPSGSAYSSDPVPLSSSPRKRVHPQIHPAQISDMSRPISPLMTKFIQFSEKQSASIRTFCKNNSGILEEDLEPLRLTICQLLRQDEVTARQAAHRYILLQQCAPLQPRDRLSYLEALCNSPKECNRIEAAVDDYLNQLEEQLAVADS